jgi:hypothetical protein
MVATAHHRICEVRNPLNQSNFLESLQTVMFAVPVQRMGFVAQKRGAIVKSMCHQRFLRAEFRMELIMENGCKPVHDDHGSVLRSCQPQQHLVSISAVPQTEDFHRLMAVIGPGVGTG